MATTAHEGVITKYQNQIMLNIAINSTQITVSVKRTYYQYKDDIIQLPFGYIYLEFPTVNQDRNVPLCFFIKILY